MERCCRASQVDSFQVDAPCGGDTGGARARLWVADESVGNEPEVSQVETSIMLGEIEAQRVERLAHQQRIHDLSRARLPVLARPTRSEFLGDLHLCDLTRRPRGLHFQ
jgi:hypothetical protein